MKKYLILCLIVMAVLGGFVFAQKHKITSDMFSMLNIKQDEIFKRLQTQASDVVHVLLVDDKAYDEFLQILKRYEIFYNVIKDIKNIDDFKRELNLVKLAAFKGKIDDLFIKNALSELYFPISERILSISDDVLSLASHSSILKQNSDIKLDVKTSRLISKSGYYYVNLTLKQGYDGDELMRFYSEARGINAVLHAPAIYQAVAKSNAQNEGFKIGIIGSVLTILFLLFVFRNFRVFYIFLSAVFGFLFGLSACFVIFEKVHILSVVISLSLVGLMLDFAVSFLGFNYAKEIKKDSVSGVKGLFLLALVIGVSGYALFLLSPMQFLHQIAIFSIFALLASFLFSYFLLPKLLDGVSFYKFEYFNFDLNLKKWHKYAIFIAFCLAIFFIAKNDFSDNIKNYSQNPVQLSQQSMIFARESGNISEFKLIKADVKNQENLLNELYENGLISSHNSLYSLINSKHTQEKIKQQLLKYAKNDEILAMLDELGINDEFEKLATLPTFGVDELKKFEIFRNFAILFDNPDLIFVSGDGDISDIAKKYDAKFYDLIAMINENFTQIKASAIKLKILGFLVAFVILSFFVGLIRSAIIILTTFLSSVITIGFFAMFDDVNIFVIFGVILASAVGIDYLLIGFKDIKHNAKVFSICVAGATTIITFALLMLSSTHAVFSFGASVSLAVLLNMLFAISLSKRQNFNII
ncbi:hypothetical protein [Campylobacter majalis]|uniref:hypothetical protein n=1 Tax=Campylobacter majalis TaxID=2790656 RepID=UPI003D69C5DF